MIRDLPLLDKPREKALNYGLSVLSDAELLAILIRTGTKDISAIDIAHKIIKEIGDLNNQDLLTIERLSKIKGVGKTKAITVLCALELGKRSLRRDNNCVIKTAGDVYENFKYYFYNKKQELFIVVFLNNKRKVIGFKNIYKGTINNLNISEKEIFKEALLRSSNNIILVHNHPSENIYPSKEDLSSTHNIIKKAKLLNINIIDHVIITSNNYYSFYDNGDLK